MAYFFYELNAKQSQLSDKIIIKNIQINKNIGKTNFKHDSFTNSRAKRRRRAVAAGKRSNFYTCSIYSTFFPVRPPHAGAFGTHSCL
jgi:hypothetical protein